MKVLLVGGEYETTRVERRGVEQEIAARIVRLRTDHSRREVEKDLCIATSGCAWRVSIDVVEPIERCATSNNEVDSGTDDCAHQVIAASAIREDSETYVGGWGK